MYNFWIFAITKFPFLDISHQKNSKKGKFQLSNFPKKGVFFGYFIAQNSKKGNQHSTCQKFPFLEKNSYCCFWKISKKGNSWQVIAFFRDFHSICHFQKRKFYNICVLKKIPKKEICHQNFLKKKLPFHLSNFWSTKMLQKKMPKKEIKIPPVKNFLFWKLLFYLSILDHQIAPVKNTQKGNIAIKMCPKKAIIPSKSIPKRKYCHQKSP